MIAPPVPAPGRVAMRCSLAGRALIKSFEQCRLTAYRDSGGVWTVGWGHTGPGVRAGLQWSQAQADAAFEADVAKVEHGVNALVLVPVTQGQFDALCSFGFNVGLDVDADTKAEGLGDSTLLRRVNAGDVAGAADEFLKWDHDGGKVVAGLTRRRSAERALFLA